MSELKGKTQPRLWTKPLRRLTPNSSLGFACIEYARTILHTELYPWQEFALIHALEIVGSLKDCINPNIIFVIDALASRSLSRVNATIQISDTGIVPGSGVGNHRMELSKEVLGVPVIEVGTSWLCQKLTPSNVPISRY